MGARVAGSEDGSRGEEWGRPLARAEKLHHRFVVQMERLPAGTRDRIQALLDEFAAQEIVMEEDGRYLGLALPENSPEPSLIERQAMIARVGQDAER